MRSHCLVVSGRQRLTRRRLERIYRAKHTSDRLIIVSVDAIDLPGPPFFFSILPLAEISASLSPSPAESGGRLFIFSPPEWL